MHPRSEILSPSIVRRCLISALVVLILKMTVEIVVRYRSYFPPDFSSSFLAGRESYFFGAYRWAFYLHLAAGPFTLLFGLLLLSDRFRRSFRKGHRILGRIQAGLVLGMLLPAGLWMSFYAQAGRLAAISFLILTILTAYTMVQGGVTAVRRQFVLHRRWMYRNYALLSSAVVLRLFGGIGQVLQIETPAYYVVISWLCWILPLVLIEYWTGRPAVVQPGSSSLATAS